MLEVSVKSLTAREKCIVGLTKPVCLCTSFGSEASPVVSHRTRTLHWPDYRQVPPSQRLHLRRQGGVSFVMPKPSGLGFAGRHERKLGVSLFALIGALVRVVNLLYDQQ